MDSVDSVEKMKVLGWCGVVCVDINIKACSNNFLLPQLLSGSAPVNTIIWAKPTRLRKWPHSNSFDLIFMGTNLLNTVTCSTAIYHTCSQARSPASHFNIPTRKTLMRAEWYFCSGHTWDFTVQSGTSSNYSDSVWAQFCLASTNLLFIVPLKYSSENSGQNTTARTRQDLTPGVSLGVNTLTSSCSSSHLTNLVRLLQITLLSFFLTTLDLLVALRGELCHPYFVGLYILSVSQLWRKTNQWMVVLNTPLKLND